MQVKESQLVVRDPFLVDILRIMIIRGNVDVRNAETDKLLGTQYNMSC